MSAPPEPVIFEWSEVDRDHIDYAFCGGLTPFSVELRRRVLDERPRVFTLVGPDDDLDEVIKMETGRVKTWLAHVPAIFGYLEDRLAAHPEEDLVWEWALEEPNSPSMQRTARKYSGPMVVSDKSVWAPVVDRTAGGIKEANGAGGLFWTIGAITRATIPKGGKVTDEEAREWARQATLAMFGLWDFMGIGLAEFSS